MSTRCAHTHQTCFSVSRVEHTCNQCGNTAEAPSTKCADCGVETAIAPWEDWPFWKSTTAARTVLPDGTEVQLPRKVLVCQDCYKPRDVLSVS